MNSYTKPSLFQSIQNSITLKYDLIFNIGVIIICFLSFGFSWIESTVNQDSHHWGLMYVPALDLKHGLIPHRDTLIYYGVLTSWIQSIGLHIFGENFKALGITTGIFYSLSLWLSYRIFLRFLSKPSAFFLVLIIFLLHSYIIYPWSNYFFYTFELLAILFFIKKVTYINYLTSGFFIGCSILVRYSSIHVILPPFIIFLFFRHFLFSNKQVVAIKKILLFLLGIIVPLIAFSLYLIIFNGMDDFLLQNQLTFSAMGKGLITKTLIDFLGNLVTGTTYVNRDSRSLFLSLIFFINLLFLISITYQSWLAKQPLNSQGKVALFISYITFFGYFNSLHIYEIFRLINGASLGIGIIFFYLETRLTKFPKKLQLVSLIPLISLCFIWANTLLFQPTSSVYAPWDFSVLSGQGVEQKEIGIFKGKLLDKNYSDRYNRIYKTLLPINSSFPIVNYTIDTTAVLINNHPRMQKSPAYFPAVQSGYPKEIKNIKQAIQNRQAIIFSNKDLKYPGYKTIFECPYVFNEFMFFYIIVPQSEASLISPA